MKIKKAMKVLSNELLTDAGLYEGWKANIAMSYVDAIANYKKDHNKISLNKWDMHIIANKAAENFIYILCRDVDETEITTIFWDE